MWRGRERLRSSGGNRRLSAPGNLTVRPARREDVRTLVDLVRELASFENALDEVELCEAALEGALFGDTPRVYCDVAEIDDVIVGSTVWFESYSTWTATPNIYLEDIYIRPSARRLGVASALMQTLARRAVASGYRRFEWSVLDWNSGAIDFYTALGARPMPEWVRYRLSGEALEELGRK
jgi:GNAT superfamily N-acetyltransferase